MKTFLFLMAGSCLSSSIASFANDFTDKVDKCIPIAEQKVKDEMHVHYPKLADLTPEVFVDIPDDGDQLPSNAVKIYLSYGCKTDSSVSYLAVGLLNDGKPCDIDEVWDTATDNANPPGVMCGAAEAQ